MAEHKWRVITIISIILATVTTIGAQKITDPGQDLEFVAFNTQSKNMWIHGILFDKHGQTAWIIETQGTEKHKTHIGRAIVFTSIKDELNYLSLNPKTFNLSQ